MTDLLLVFRETGPFAFVLLVQALLIGFVAVASVGLWAANRRMSPGLLGVSIGATALTPMVASAFGLSMAMNAIARASAEMQMMLLANGISVVLGVSTLTTLVLGSVLVLVIGAAGTVGALRGPRGFVAPGLAAVLGLIVLGGSTAAGLVSEDVPLRVGLYAVCLLPVLAALTACPVVDAKATSSAGPVAAAACSAAFASLVAVCEAGSLANGSMLMFHVLASASAEMKQPLLQDGLEVITAGRPFALASIGAALGIAVVGAVNALEPDRPAQNAGVWLGLLGALVPAVVFAWSPCIRAMHLLGALW